MTLERPAQVVNHHGFEQEKIKIRFRDDKPTTAWKRQSLVSIGVPSEELCHQGQLGSRTRSRAQTYKGV
jgi:hypothetical protein